VAILDIPVSNKIEEARLAFTVADGKYYISDEDGKIYQGSLAKPADRKAVYQEPEGMYGIRKYLYSQDNKAYLAYHVGGTVMGADVTVHLKTDGTWEEISGGYLFRKDFGNITVTVHQGVPPMPNNLTVKLGDFEGRLVGDPDYLYGWTWDNMEKNRVYSASRDLELINDDIYVLACDRVKDNGTTGLHKVNVKTNATGRVIDATVFAFKIEGDCIYYNNRDDCRIYRMPLSGGDAVPLTKPAGIAIEDMAVLNGEVYYIVDDGAKSRLFRTGYDDPINPGGDSPSITLQNNYLIATFNCPNGNAYRLMVFNLLGEVVFKSSDELIPTTVTIDNAMIYYVDSGLRQVVCAPLLGI
jgi:hypothetical protein